MVDRLLEEVVVCNRLLFGDLQHDGILGDTIHVGKFLGKTGIVVRVQQAGRADIDKVQGARLYDIVPGGVGKAVLAAAHIQLQGQAVHQALVEEIVDGLERIRCKRPAERFVSIDGAVFQGDDGLEERGQPILVGLEGCEWQDFGWGGKGVGWGRSDGGNRVVDVKSAHQALAQAEYPEQKVGIYLPDCIAIAAGHQENGRNGAFLQPGVEQPVPLEHLLEREFKQ